MTIKTGIASLSFFALMGIAGAAAADTLLIDRVDQPGAKMAPARGMSMSQIQATYGAPAQRLDPRGGQKRQWPTINRWVYPEFTIYFEKNRVIDVVANQAFTGEIGPKPAVL